MKIVLDTNILVSALSTYSKNHLIFESLVNKKYELLISNDIILEYTEVIHQKYKRRTLEFLISYVQYAVNVRYTNPYFKWNMIINDADDNKFVDCALAGQADFIVTNDKHFDILKTIDFPHVNVINAEEFIDILKVL